MKKSLAFLAGLLTLLVAGSMALLTSLSQAQWKDSTPSATYLHGVLHVSIPYNAPRSGDGNLTVEVLDPEDTVFGRFDRNVNVTAGRGFPEQELALGGSPAVDDLVWNRLRYRFTYRGDHAAALRGIVAISRILRHPVVHVLSQQSYVTGEPAAVRLVVDEADNETPITSGSVVIELLATGQATEQKAQTLYKGLIDPRGTTRAQFHFPAGLTGNYALRYAVDTPLGTAGQTQAIRLEDKSSVLLTTEKHVYQPGQTIHVRALALDRASHQAIDNRKLTFEAEDSRGNKVFRAITQTDAYGVASAEFSLADEVNLGTWHLRTSLADSGDGATPNQAELAVHVERYVLPRFKVDVDLGNKDATAKRGYRPGDHVTGTVRTNYFFGKAVDHAEVVVKASAMDVDLVDAAKVEGKTDGDGAFAFDMRLPGFFAGQAANHGAARVLIEATVKDNAGHSETQGVPVMVSESPLLVTAVPESGTMVPGFENQVFILTSYPDGTPAKAEVRVHAQNSADQTATTDAGGVAVVQLTGTGQTTRIGVDAKDTAGNSASVPLVLESRSGSDAVMLHTEQALYRAGDRIRLQIRSTRTKGSVYVDVVKDGQTIATHDLDIVNGSARLEFAATPDMAGTVDLNAYVFGRDGRPIGDHRMVFVQPADELRIETTSDAPVYKPGDEARIGFRVINKRGEGVQAVLGLEVVDQAVFALAEKQPGFAKVFFYLEQELMKPRYEIHSISLPTVISATEDDQQQRAARALFSATETVGTNNASLNFGGDDANGKFAEYLGRYQKRFHAQSSQVTAALERSGGPDGERCSGTGLEARLWGVNLADPWGSTLLIGNPNWYTGSREVRSAGPDGQFRTGDDLVDSVVDPWCKSTNDAGTIRIVHAGSVGITGTVVDPAGAVVAGSRIRIMEDATGTTYVLKAGADGGFSLSALHAGRYRLEVSSPGFRTSLQEFVLQEGERAVASVLLQIGAVSESISVTAEAGHVQFAAASALPMAAPPPGPMRAMLRDTAMSVSTGAFASVATKVAAPETHVRSWFPESLYVSPEIITDKDGRASVTIPIADNITTWRMAMLASTKQGALGSGTSSLKVFQDFFTEMDLPVTLTQGDEVSIPVALYNYSGSRGDVRLRLEGSDWYSLEGDVADKNVTVESGRVGGSQFNIAAKRIGKFKLTLRAEMDGGAKRADILVREIEVVPNGREQSIVYNGRLDSVAPVAQHEVNFPATAIPDASTIFVRLYPGPLSQVVEGMDTLLRMPYGCFEQTSSSTYPNVLALDYMKRTKKLTPEVSAKAQGYIATGYQRLVTFEVPGGGFSWFGTAPANKILTSYGLMEFSDMSKVHDVDPKIIQRTQAWLASQQQGDGSWKPDSGGINEGATNNFQSDVLRITAYVAWALEVTGYNGPAVDRARQFIETHMSEATRSDAYTLAVLANFAVDYSRDRAFADRMLRMLVDAKNEQNDQVLWKAAQTGMYGSGTSATVETTGLAVQALLKWGGEPAVAAKAMNYIVAKKDSAGTWGTTQATIMALRALLLSTGRGGGTAKGDVEVLLNGKVAAKLTLTAENNDLFHQFVFKGSDAQTGNRVEIRFAGEGLPAYQVAGRYFVPWSDRPEREALSIDVSYDRTRLEQDQIATATATVRNRVGTTANMVMVDLGIPPGFELLSEDLDAYRQKSAGKKSGRLEKFTLTPTQAILYFDSIAAGDALKLSFRLRAKYPIRASTFASRVYEYYDPEVSSLARPVLLEVRKK